MPIIYVCIDCGHRMAGGGFAGIRFDKCTKCGSDRVTVEPLKESKTIPQEDEPK